MIDDVGGPMKYASLQSPHLQDVLIKERITAAHIETNAIILGTEQGFVHVMSFAGQLIKSFKAHDRPVNDVSVDNHGLIIASCSDNGTVVVHTIGPDEDKENVIHLSEPLKVVCVEDDNSSKRDKSFIVGGLSGQLTHHRTVWFAQKNVILFQGADSAVTNISWRGNLVAWSDATQVRIMDISTQSAICYLESPAGVGIDTPFPCSLYWETDSDLFVCWADSFRHLELVVAGLHIPGNNRETIARTVTDWQADFIICGVSAFDVDHVMLLGYVPPDEEEVGAVYSQMNSPGSPSAITDNLNTHGNKPEIQICKRTNGQLVSADTLPLTASPSCGPWQFRFMTTYQCLTHHRDSQRWKLGDIIENRGGARGFCPTGFIISPSELVVCSVRDVNDRILVALQNQELQQAVNLAYSDKSSLKHYKYSELVTLYMTYLLDKCPAEGGSAHIGDAVKECQRLIGGDTVLWERWVYAFAKRRLLPHLILSIPMSSPRLPSTVYEVVLESLLQSDTKALYSIVRKWGCVSPALFDHQGLLLRLENYRGLDRWLLQAEAMMYVFSKQYPKALSAYLQCALLQNSNISHRSQPVTADDDEEEEETYMHVFELIEQHDLFDSVRHQLHALMLLSREHCAALLVRNIDRLPVPQVVQQLQNERQLLHWYLHSIFTALPDAYNTAEYAAYHEMQVPLYAEFAPLDHADKSKESGFLQFLRTSSFVPLDMALKQCETRSPPLYAEMVYILSRMGKEKQALGLLLREIQDVQQAVDFVQAHQSSLGLWGDLIDYALVDSQFLANLLDYIGEAEVSPLTIISRIPPSASLPLLSQRLLKVLSQQGFQAYINERCNEILAEDTLHLQRSLNQTQRKALKVEPSWRCATCSRPLFLPPAALTAPAATIKPPSPLVEFPPQIWGTGGTSGSGIVVFNNKVAFHSVCYRRNQNNDHCTDL